MTIAVNPTNENYFGKEYTGTGRRKSRGNFVEKQRTLLCAFVCMYLYLPAGMYRALCRPTVSPLITNFFGGHLETKIFTTKIGL